MRCERCGVDVDLPFKCNYCEHYFCPNHRLPENHECSETWRVKALRSARSAMAPAPFSAEVRSVLLPPKQRSISFSETEKRHLIVGTALVTAAGVSLFGVGLLAVGTIGIIIASVLFALGFILHELAHKYVAQGYGLWAEFRLNMTGVVLTALSILSPLKFIAPGAVMISGFTDKMRMGRTAFAGPLVNIIISAGILTLLPAFPGTWIYTALLAGSAVNAFLAVFNLIPFSILDGHKVYSWDRRYWALLFLVSLALTIYTNYILRIF